MELNLKLPEGVVKMISMREVEFVHRLKYNQISASIVVERTQ